MDTRTACYFKVFGFEEGCGGEDQLVCAVRKLPGVESATWHSPSHGVCVGLHHPADPVAVMRQVRTLGYQVTYPHTSCPCCAV